MLKYIITIFIFCFTVVVGQDVEPSGLFLNHRIYKAHKKFEKTHYQSASEKYEKLYEKDNLNNVQKGDYAEVLLELHQSEKAEAILDAISDRTLHEEELLIRAAMYNGNHAKADSISKTHPELEIFDMSITDSRSLSDYLEEIRFDEYYRMQEMTTNSEDADFAPYEKDSILYFVSDRGMKHILKRGNKWKDVAYLNVYEINSDDEVSKSDSKINTSYHDGPICFNSTGDIVFVTRNNYNITNYGNNKEDDNSLTIFMSRLQSNGKWGDFIPLPINSDVYSNSHPFLSRDDKTLYFASDRPGGFGGVDLYKMSFDGETFGEPENLGDEINTAGDEMFPFVGDDDHFYFSSNGYAGFGGMDIFVAKSYRDKFIVKNMGHPINSHSDDFSLFMKDKRNGYFASNREDGTGSDDIYELEVLSPVPFPSDITIRVVDKNTKSPLVDAEVHVSDSSLNIMDMGYSDSVGMLTQTVMDNVEVLHFDVLHYDGYKPFIKDFPLQEEVYILDLEPLDLGLYGYVYDVLTNERLEDARMSFIVASRDTLMPTLRDSAKYRQGLENNTRYEVSVSKEGYLPYDFIVNTENLSSWKERNIPLSTTFEIEDILYDFDKWDITELAALELDKLVKYLERHPSILVRLESHTDARGSREYNQTLSERRAASATEYIVENGIGINRITSQGFGESRLKNVCSDDVWCSVAAHQENRRTEIHIVLNND